MTNPQKSEHNLPKTALGAREFAIIALLVLSVIINYVDRTNLSLAAPLLQPELHITSTQLGALFAAFSWTYAFLQILGISGWLADNLPVGYVLLTGYLLWTAATFATGFFSTFTTLFIVRLVLGAGESVAYPCYSRIFATLPQHHRGRANACIDAGTKLGPSAGALLGGLLMVHFGWRALFFGLGLGGLFWAIPWLFVMPRGRAPQGAEDPSRPVPRTAELLGKRSAWGTCLGHFCGNYFFYFLMAWLPLYLTREAHMTVGRMTRVASLAFFVIALSTLAAGWITDHRIVRGASPTRVRKTAIFCGLTSASLVGGLVLFPGTSPVPLALLFLACSGYGAYASNHWAISQTLAGPQMAGRWSSLQNGIANLAGIIGPWLAGWLVQRSGSLRFAFLIAGVVAFCGALIWTLMVGRVEQEPWSTDILASPHSPQRPAPDSPTFPPPVTEGVRP